MEEKFQYSLPINNKDKKENETFIYRHPLAIDKDFESFISIQTLQQLYTKVLQSPNKPLLGKRSRDSNGNLSSTFNWFTVETVFSTARKIGSGILNLDLISENTDWNNYKLKFVGIYSKNSVRYSTLDIACGIYNITSIPIYDTLGEEATEFAFEQTKMKTCFVTSDHVEKIVENKKNKNLFKSLENLIIFDKENMKEDWPEKFKDVIKILTWEEVEQEGEKDILPWASVKPNDIYCFSYTSGTTGTPKGAMITHKNVCSAICCTDYVVKVTEEDSYLSFLPMAHVLERMFFNVLMYHHVKIGVFSGDIKLLMEDLKILQPTIFLAVPRILNKIYSGMRKKMDQSMLKSLIDSAIDQKIDNLHGKSQTTHWIHDKVFFKQARDSLGGKVRIMMTGSAPINVDTMDFLKVAFSAQILEGYGQTEACAFECVTNINDGFSGHVGGPVVVNEFKLVDCPDLGYTSKDKNSEGVNEPKGELWVRGPNVIPGFFKLDEKNKETFTEDGWLKSGDIAVITPDRNRLKIIDRKKNLFKLSQGEYIAAEKLESAYEDAHGSLKDVFIYGDSYKSCIVAVVNVDKDKLADLANDLGSSEDSEDSEELKKKLMEKFLAVAKNKNFNSLEKIRGIIINTEDWQEKGLVTTSFKKKRKDLKEYFKEQIDNLYKTLE